MGRPLLWPSPSPSFKLIATLTWPSTWPDLERFFPLVVSLWPYLGKGSNLACRFQDVGLFLFVLQEIVVLCSAGTIHVLTRTESFGGCVSFFYLKFRCLCIFWILEHDIYIYLYYTRLCTHAYLLTHGCVKGQCILIGRIFLFLFFKGKGDQPARLEAKLNVVAWMLR